MSHSEIWDDSALVDSWNDALDEYKHYHSIHARGQKVENVLREAESQGSGLSGEMDYEDGEASDLMAGDPHAKKNLPKEKLDHAPIPHGNESQVEDKQQAVPDQTFGGTQSKPPALPQHLIGQVHDEGLKNLLMAWYYAGYYTGLHEGQQLGPARKDNE